MIKVMLDTNVFDSILNDQDFASLLKGMIQSKKIRLLLNRTVQSELPKEKLQKTLEILDLEYTGNSVGRAGILCAGDSIGNGEVFDKSKGISKKRHNDSLILDSASSFADWIVTRNTGDFREPARKSRANCKVFSLEEFILELQKR